MNGAMRIPKIKKMVEFGILLMIIKTFLSSSVTVPYSDLADNILTVLICIIFLISILSQGYKLDKLIVCGLILGAALYSCVKIGNSSLLITILTCLAIRDQDIDKIISFIYRYTLLFFGLYIIFSSIFSVLTGSELWTLYQGKVVFHLGLGHRNRLAIIVYNLMILWIYINFEKVKKQNYFVLIIIGLVTFFATRTKTFLIEVIIAIILLKLVNMRKPVINKIINKLSSLIFPVLLVITNVLVVHFLDNNFLVSMINTLLTNRIRLGAYALKNYGFTLFGQVVNDNAVWDEVFGLNSFTFDNIYSFLAINQGIVWAIILAICLWKMSTLKDEKINYCIILWCLYGLTEVHGLDCYLFFPLILIAYILKNGRWKRARSGVK